MMAEVFTVSSNDAAAIQHHYEQIIETLLRTLLDDKENKNTERKGLQIFDRDRLVYGRDDNQFRDEVSGFSGQLLNPQLITQLQQLRESSVGSVVEGAANKRVELDGKIVLQSDESGRVIVNTLLQFQIVEDTNYQKMNDNQQESLQLDTDSSNQQVKDNQLEGLELDKDSSNQQVKDNQLEGIQSSREQSNQQLKDNCQASFQLNRESSNQQVKDNKQAGFHLNRESSIQQRKDNERENIKLKSDKSPEPGATRVMQSLAALEDSPLRTLLNNEIQQLQAEIKALQHERSLYRELIEKRLQQPQNTSWWQQVINNVSTVVNTVSSAVKMAMQEFKERSRQHQSAASLKTLFHHQVQPGSRDYQAAGYQISRDGSLYEVKDSATGKQIMQFRSTPLGVRVEEGKLESTDIKHIDALQYSLKSQEPLPDAFAPIGKNEAEYFARIDKITCALEQYAIAQQRDVQIDGKFSYKWQAMTDGKIRIDAKDGRGTLLMKVGGQLKTCMSERDLSYFEQMLPKLQGLNDVQKSVTSSKSKQLER